MLLLLSVLNLTGNFLPFLIGTLCLEIFVSIASYICNLFVALSMPRSLFTEAALANLNALVAAKSGLIRKALGVMELPIEVTVDKVSFPWFVGQPTPEEIKAYEHFICVLCKMTRNQKRITAKRKRRTTDK
jgi:hypothetical protein